MYLHYNIIMSNQRYVRLLFIYTLLQVKYKNKNDTTSKLIVTNAQLNDTISHHESSKKNKKINNIVPDYLTCVQCCFNNGFTFSVIYFYCIADSSKTAALQSFEYYTYIQVLWYSAIVYSGNGFIVGTPYFNLQTL